jgi:hypothetical protein
LRSLPLPSAAPSRGVLTAMLLATAVLACGRAPLPPRLGGLPRTRMWTGARADNLTRHLPMKEFQPRESTVAEYGAPGQLRVLLARYRDGVEAHRALALILEHLSRSESRFSPPRERRDSPGHWYTVAPDGRHEVGWVSDGTLFWVMGEPRAVERAMTRLPRATHGELT